MSQPAPALPVTPLTAQQRAELPGQATTARLSFIRLLRKVKPGNPASTIALPVGDVGKALHALSSVEDLLAALAAAEAENARQATSPFALGMSQAHQDLQHECFALKQRAQAAEEALSVSQSEADRLSRILEEERRKSEQLVDDLERAGQAGVCIQQLMLHGTIDEFRGAEMMQALSSDEWHEYHRLGKYTPKPAPEIPAPARVCHECGNDYWPGCLTCREEVGEPEITLSAPCQRDCQKCEKAEAPAALTCWCQQCRDAYGLTLEPIDRLFFHGSQMVRCPDCGNKRCPKANFHGNACTKSNAVGQPGSSWENVKPFGGGAGVGLQGEEAEPVCVHCGRPAVGMCHHCERPADG